VLDAVEPPPPPLACARDSTAGLLEIAAVCLCPPASGAGGGRNEVGVGTLIVGGRRRIDPTPLPSTVGVGGAVDVCSIE
jgi:hypothetical protein